MNTNNGKQFQRWSCYWPKTLAFRQFRNHQTEINRLYWALSVPHREALRAHSASAPWPPPEWRLRPAERQKDIYFTAARDLFNSASQDALNWLRLSALLGITSSLEIYLRAAVGAALESDTGLLIGTPRATDGVKLLKENRMPDTESKLESVASGTWASRRANLAKIFGNLPDELDDKSTAELDAMRKMRNNVGHHFGRDLGEAPDAMRRAAHPMERLSETRLQNWLGLSFKVANAIDKMLLPHIGDYEVIRFYHRWRRKFKGNAMQERDALQTATKAELGSGGGSQYFRSLIQYYARL